MKRIIAMTLCAVLSLSVLTACGTGERYDPSQDTGSMQAGGDDLVIPDLTGSGAQIPENKIPETTLPLVPQVTETTAPAATEPAVTETVPETTAPSGKLPTVGGQLVLNQDNEGSVAAGENLWLAFTTSGAAGSAYQITITNKSKGSLSLYSMLCDEQAQAVQTGEAKGGKTLLLDAGELKPNTTYYLRLNPVADEAIYYSVLVNESATSTMVPGSNQNNAVLVPQETLVHVHVPLYTYAWFSFTTGNIQTTYNLTCVNETASSDEMGCVVLDEFGTEQGDLSVDSKGEPVTIALDQLAPNTTYYIRVKTWQRYHKLDQDISLIIRDVNRKADAHRTTDNLAESLDPEALILSGAVPGTNANLALPLPYDYLYKTTCPLYGNQWYSFVTGENPEATYRLVTVNETPGGDEMSFDVYDMYGNWIDYIKAYQDGTAQTLTLTGLKPDSLHYIRLHTDHRYKKIDQNYSLRIVSSEPVKKDTLAFETPFEINETQVQFVVNQAIFIDKQKAMTVLQPVAEAILAHPDRTILIAGSTATDGTQASCIGLSVQRAEAVRDLLVDTYGVPASQLKVVGLGYADDPFERGQDIDAKGNFVESEAKKNRRVVVLDAADPIAQEILKKQK